MFVHRTPILVAIGLTLSRTRATIQQLQASSISQPKGIHMNNDNSNGMDGSRRRFFGVAGGALGAVVLAGPLSRVAHADDLPHLDPADPTAQALKYTEDNTKAGPPHQDGQACASCNFFGGGDGYAPCQLFPGKAVNAKGWCSGYAKKA